MGEKILPKDRMTDLINALMSTTEVVAPVFVGKQTYFKAITDAEQIQWDYANTTIPPTEHMLPQSETLFSYERRGSDVSLLHEVDETERTIIGIRPCDVHSLRMMDRVFTGKFEDPYYLTRRQHTTLISMMCTEPGSTCFCTSFGTGPDLDTSAESDSDANTGGGSDLHLVDLGDRFLVRVLTERGQAVVEQAGTLFAEPTSTDQQAATDAATAATSKIQRHLETDGLADALKQMFESDYWERISRKCIACGACTYVCPVCYCFDVADTCAQGQSQGERVRCWDACTFRSFALLAGGHNPRPTIKEGYRQKMYHKFNYAVQRYGYSLCVGCGRCMDSCPVNLDIVEVLSGAKAATTEEGISC